MLAWLDFSQHPYCSGHNLYHDLPGLTNSHDFCHVGPEHSGFGYVDILGHGLYDIFIYSHSLLIVCHKLSGKVDDHCHLDHSFDYLHNNLSC